MTKSQDQQILKLKHELDRALNMYQIERMKNGRLLDALKVIYDEMVDANIIELCRIDE